MKSNLDVDTIEFKISLTNGLFTSEPLGLTESGLGPGLAWTRPPFAAGTSRTAHGSELRATAAGSVRRSSPGPVAPPRTRGHALLVAAPGPLSPPVREPPQPEEGQQLADSQSGQFNDGLEDSGLLESSTRLKPHEAQNYRKKALWVSWFSIVVTLALAVAAFTVSVMRYSASAFGFAFDAVLDVLSSAIVLWRYSNAAAVHSAHREYL
ncbi:LOW QUALITY PROTEIN: transmembrane protein 163 [Myotis lucifugus]|uniref:LOW QUALITY PROTEIN: transmembrane protein 163 n=1 Tax=Myotis lucifugus TaxID=59463 RepID=UPI0003C4464E|nr:LOW QUALITY PROTEIN: transmembrane protein 163 [Myotis lucifugus]